MSPAVAMVAIISERAVEMTAIVVGGWLVHTAIPQLRMSKPADPQDGGKS